MSRVHRRAGPVILAGTKRPTPASCYRSRALLCRYGRRRARTVTTGRPGFARRGPAGVLLLSRIGRCRRNNVGRESVTGHGPTRRQCAEPAAEVCPRAGAGATAPWAALATPAPKAIAVVPKTAVMSSCAPRRFSAEHSVIRMTAYSSTGRVVLLHRPAKNRPDGDPRHHRWHPSMRHASGKLCPPVSTPAAQALIRPVSKPRRHRDSPPATE
jgi:hypothetical protein